MKKWPLLTAIASCSLIALGSSVKAQDVILSPEEVLSEATQLNFSNVGLRIKESNIVSAFHGHLMTYVGECPGRVWTGNATKDNVRFISYSVPPAKHLRVALTNVTSGESITKKYTKEGKGSFDFPVIKLGTGNGQQQIQYSIYNKETNSVLEQGDFSYDLSTTFKSATRYGSWRSELFCASRESDALKDCEIVGAQQRLYCNGSRTSRVRDKVISHRRRYNHNTKNHSGSRRKYYSPRSRFGW